MILMNLFSSKDNRRNHCENPKLLLFVTCDQTFQWAHFILSTPVLVSYTQFHSLSYQPHKSEPASCYFQLLSCLTSSLRHNKDTANVLLYVFYLFCNNSNSAIFACQNVLLCQISLSWYMPVDIVKFVSFLLPSN